MFVACLVVRLGIFPSPSFLLVRNYVNTYTTIIKVGFYCSENLSAATKELSLENMFVACLVVRLYIFLDPSIGRTPKLAFSKLSEISRLILGDIRYLRMQKFVNEFWQPGKG